MPFLLPHRSSTLRTVCHWQKTPCIAQAGIEFDEMWAWEAVATDPKCVVLAAPRTCTHTACASHVNRIVPCHVP